VTRRGGVGAESARLGRVGRGLRREVGGRHDGKVFAATGDGGGRR
jgi:hypothetical protein